MLQVRRIVLISFAALCLLLATGAHASARGSKVWGTNFAEAQAEARQSGRPLVVHFYADWCGPCRQMEPVLNSGPVVKTLNSSFVAVKINSDHHPDLVKRYGIEALPSDIILSPQGTVLTRLSGKHPQANYLASLCQIEQNNTTQTVVAAKPVLPEKTAGNPAGSQKPVKNTLTANQSSTHDVDNDVDPAAPKLQRDPLLAVNGYCPVTLRKSRTWKVGDKRYTTVHQGLTYYFAGPQELESFQSNAGLYAPRLLGCDPVALAEKEVTVPGTPRYGAYYEGELYLFETAESRSQFRKNPGKYARPRQVKLEDVQRARV